MTQISDEYKSAQIAYAEALAYAFGVSPDTAIAVLNGDSVGFALDDLHAAWLQFSDEEDFGEVIAAQDLLDAMAEEAALDSDTAAGHEERQRMEEAAAWDEHCGACPSDDDDWDEIADRDERADEDDWTPEYTL